MIHIAFAWSGLPDYAARCIKTVIERIPTARVSVIGTRPGVPIEGMERSLGRPVVWVDPQDHICTWSSLGLTIPEIFFQGGYYLPAFNALGRDCRGRSRVILLSDSNWLGSIRQRFVDPLRHRLILRSRFDGIVVPGLNGQRYARYMGYPVETTECGLCGADPDIFFGKDRLSQRKKIFLFVGQFIPRKNVLGLAEGFQRFATVEPGWKLHLCGSGPQRPEIPEHADIIIHDFLQPLRLAELMREARCLVLPSLEENWGLVVHEAALSGCALALTRCVGAGADLAHAENAVHFAPGSVDAIVDAMREFAAWDDVRWDLAGSRSLMLASKFGPSRFAEAVLKLLKAYSLIPSN